MIKPLDAARMTDVLPRILAAQNWVRAFSDAMGSVHEKTLAMADASQMFTAIDTAAEEILDIVAVNWKIDWYDTAYSTEQKRRILKTAIEVRRLMGTVRAVKLQMNAVYPGADIEEWFQYGGRPHRFRVFIQRGSAVLDEDALKRLFRSIDAVKRTSSKLDDVHITIQEAVGALYAGGAVSRCATVYMREVPDTIGFCRGLRTGGRFGALARIGVLEDRQYPRVRQYARVNGRIGAWSQVGGRDADTQSGPVVRQTGCVRTVTPGGGR